jgi:hypothetical protein
VRWIGIIANLFREVDVTEVRAKAAERESLLLIAWLAGGEEEQRAGWGRVPDLWERVLEELEGRKD